jgi:hypothetical protein
MTWELRENGSLCFDGMVVGKVTDEPRIVLNLGWAKAAGVGVTVQGDPEVDKKRGGIILEREG